VNALSKSDLNECPCFTFTRTFNNMKNHKKYLVLSLLLTLLFSCNRVEKPETSSEAIDEKVAVAQENRFELPQAGAMIPPVPAIVLGVKGDSTVEDDLTIVWTFVLEGSPALIGISVPNNSAITGDTYVGLELLKKHKEFTLNVPDESWVTEFDHIDMTASSKTDKFAENGLTRLPSKLINAPGIAEAAIVLECKVLQMHHLPPQRTVFFAEVVRTSVHPGVTDENGRLISKSRTFFGMTAGNGEFWTFGEKVGNIGKTLKREDIRY
jgi:flavin reductase (DIM6/NTAB) family NADH-FMN oxidoreductase RutF